MTTFLRVEKKPVTRDPVLISGVPDSGNVAKIIMDYLILALKAELCAEIYSSHFPSQVYVGGDGVGDLMKSGIYYSDSTATNDVLLFSSDAQATTAQGAYEIVDKVLTLAKDWGVKKVFSVGAYITGSFSDTPEVYGTCTDSDLIEELKSKGVKTIDSGNITWMNGLILGVTKLMELKGYFISGETSGYVQDAKASRNVVMVLSDILGWQMDYSKLEKQVSETEAQIKSLQSTHEGSRERPKTGIYS